MRIILLIMIGLSTFICADFSKSNGVVTDSKTTLQWQDDYIDNGGNVKGSTWIEAINYCEALSLDGSDWRLPNKAELLSIVDYDDMYSPMISPIFIKNISGGYWSSTSLIGNENYASIVYFNYGHTRGFSKTNTNYVRCVRAGK